MAVGTPVRRESSPMLKRVEGVTAFLGTMHRLLHDPASVPPRVEDVNEHGAQITFWVPRQDAAPFVSAESEASECQTTSFRIRP